MYTGVLCETEGLAEKLSSLEGVDRIYSYEYPYSGSGKEKGKKWIQLLPYVFRSDTKLTIDSRSDGVMVRNTDELMYVLSEGYRGEVVSDSCLYTMNSEAVKTLLSMGVTRAVYPLELEFKELRERGFAELSELVLYGRSPLMISANCVYKDSTKKCAGKEQEGDGSRREDASNISNVSGAGKGQFYVNLTDRKRTDFPVLCDCRYCCNVIYNSVPTSLHKAMERVRELSPASVRLDFTTEDFESAEKIIKYYVNLIEAFDEGERSGAFGAAGIEIPGELESFTYGHFRNGVE